MDALKILEGTITNCTLCTRLVEYRELVARVKRRAYRESTYWGRPVPGFGDPAARLLLIGLAPGAHGANRTGRVFTGDSSGDFLYRALHMAGFASQPTSVSSEDGLTLKDAYITAAVRCAPPDNKPLPEEVRTCRPYLKRELMLLEHVKVIVTLGKLAFDTYLSVLQDAGTITRRSAFAFGHNLEHRTHTALPIVISSYHPSQQNTQTGKLTEQMFADVFEKARLLIDLRASLEVLPDHP